MRLFKQNAQAFGINRSRKSDLDAAEKLLGVYREAVAEMWAHAKVSKILISNAPGPVKAEPLPTTGKPWWM